MNDLRVVTRGTTRIFLAGKKNRRSVYSGHRHHQRRKDEVTENTDKSITIVFDKGKENRKRDIPNEQMSRIGGASRQTK